MDHKKHNHIDPWDDGVYGTGNTIPPKSNGGVIALLLMLVIFLSGIVSALSFLNIQLFQQLNQQNQEQAPMSLTIVQDAEASNPKEAARESIGGTTNSQEISGTKLPTSGKPTLGLLGDAITKFDQAYFHVPQGLYLTQVLPGTSAAEAGIEPGDILISLNGELIPSQIALDTLVSGFAVGDTVQAVFYQGGEEITLELTITESSD